jgi:Uri superfamily endonuclease
MIDGDLLVKELEKLLNDNIEKLLIPHVRGNSIRIKHHIIRKSKAGWLIYDIKENQQIAKMFSKTAAIALAKTLAQGLDEIEKIQYLDFNIKKNYNDAIFAKHSLIKTNNQIIIRKLNL